jgi:hypothetical protein
VRTGRQIVEEAEVVVESTPSLGGRRSGAPGPGHGCVVAHRGGYPGQLARRGSPGVHPRLGLWWAARFHPPHHPHAGLFLRIAAVRARRCPVLVRLGGRY